MPKLIIARHGETTYNAQGRWTGLTDVDLTEKGFEEARQAGKAIAEHVDVINLAHYSMLKRTFKTMMTMLGEVGCCPDISIQGHKVLNERNYGVYTHKIKEDVRAKHGDEMYMNIRRGWDYPIPDGQTLKDVHDDQIVPFHNRVIVPDLRLGKTALVVTSNNPCRAYVKHLEGIPDDEVSELELGTAEFRIYDFDPELNIVDCVSQAIGEVH